MIGYHNRLRKDVERWQKAGWLTAEGVNAIRAEAAHADRRFGLATVLGVLGAVLIGFAAMSFVAANWQSMPKLARQMLLFAGLWGSYGVAAVLYSRGLHAFASAAVLAGVAVFGASIMLIAQMYHMEGNPPDAVLLWALGAALAGLMLRSNPALVAAMVLASLWSIWETALSDHLHLPFLLLWGLIAAGFYWNEWRPGFHLTALSLSGWIVTLGFVFLGGHAHWLVVAIGVVIAFAAALGGPVIDRLAPISKAVVGYGIAVGYAGLFILQFIEGGDNLLLKAILSLMLLVAAIFWGWMNDNRGALWLGYIGFSIEILSLYFKTLGSLLGTSLFFLIAGLLVILLSWLAFQLHKRQGTDLEARL